VTLPETNSKRTRKLVVGSDDSSPFGAKKAYFRGSNFMSLTHKKREALEDDYHHLFKQLKTGWWFQLFFIFTPTWGR